MIMPAGCEPASPVITSPVLSACAAQGQVGGSKQLNSGADTSCGLAASLSSSWHPASLLALISMAQQQ